MFDPKKFDFLDKRSFIISNISFGSLNDFVGTLPFIYFMVSFFLEVNLLYQLLFFIRIFPGDIILIFVFLLPYCLEIIFV